MPKFLGKPLADLGQKAIFHVVCIELKKIIIFYLHVFVLFVLLCLFSEAGCFLLVMVLLDKAELLAEIHELPKVLRQKMVVTCYKLGCKLTQEAWKILVCKRGVSAYRSIFDKP